jgi:ectoine hydroxylase-related dioxygenase (phytanoyl-CoA dioxygenase family)
MIEMTVPWVESPFFEATLRERKLTAAQERDARQYHDLGYLVLEDLIDESESRRIIDEVAPLYGTAVTGKRTHFRLQDGWEASPAVARLAAHPRVLETLQFLYGRTPIPFQTLNFPRGSQQPGHSDQIHFSSLPARFMCGVWVALEDITAENGPLFYYPGSHRLPEYDFYDLGVPDYPAYEVAIAELMAARGFKREELRVKRGTALIWSSNIVHGGMPIAREGATRHSQVTHYYFDRCIYYTPMHSNRTVGEYELREQIIDIRTGRLVPQSWNGRPFVARSTHDGCKRIELTDVKRTSPVLEAARRVADHSGPFGRALKSGWKIVRSITAGTS